MYVVHRGEFRFLVNLYIVWDQLFGEIVWHIIIIDVFFKHISRIVQK